MKRWIAETIIGIAVIFGWKTPGWIVRLAPGDELQALSRREQALTELLQQGEPRAPAMPAFLEARIERAIIEAEKPRRTIPWRDWLVLPVTAAAALLLLGLFFMDAVRQPAPVFPDAPAAPELAVTPVPQPLPLERVVATIPTLEESALASNLLLRPLAREKARLTSDVTNALRFVAHSVLPESYIERVDANLDSLAAEYNGSL